MQGSIPQARGGPQSSLSIFKGSRWMHIPAVLYLNQPIIAIGVRESHAEILILSGSGGGNPRPLLAMPVNHTTGVSRVTTVKLNFNSSLVETGALTILCPLSTIAPHPIVVDHTPASSTLASSYYRENLLTNGLYIGFQTLRAVLTPE